MIHYSVRTFLVLASILWAADSDPLEKARLFAVHLKNATRETGIWKLDNELYGLMRHSFDQHLKMSEKEGLNEDNPFERGIYGASGTKEWTLEKSEQGWQIVQLSGAFTVKEAGRCDIAMVSDNAVLTLPDSPPFIYVSVSTTTPEFQPRQNHPNISLIQRSHCAVISMTALPFDTPNEVVSFLGFARAIDFGLREEEAHANNEVSKQPEAQNKAIMPTARTPTPRNLLKTETTLKQKLEPPGAHDTDFDEEDLQIANMPISKSRQYDYVYHAIATALTFVVACCYGGAIARKLEKTSIETYESIDPFNSVKNGQLADALQEKEVESDKLRETNGVLNKTIEAMQEQLRSVEEDSAQFEAFKVKALAREAEMKSKVDSLRSAAKEYAQRESLLQEHYVQARDISRRKEAALKERLEEQCLISESLNAAVEEMQRLVTAIIEANESLAADSLQPGVQDDAPEQEITTEARQIASGPDGPVDPTMSGMPANTMTSHDAATQRFVTEVYLTLHLEPHGYDSIPRLLRELSEHSDLDGEATARELGYGSFENFLQSHEMDPRIIVGARPDGRRCYKAYPTKDNMEHYVAQQLGTDYGNTRRALARQREENNRLRRLLESTMERIERLKSEAPKLKVVLDSSRFRTPSKKPHTPAGTVHGTDPASRFRPASSRRNVDGPSTSRPACDDKPAPPSGSVQTFSENSTPSLEVRRRIDELENMVHCRICMDRLKDTAFICGHTYCNECAVELKQCTFGCKKQNGKPLTFKYRVFFKTMFTARDSEVCFDVPTSLRYKAIHRAGPLKLRAVLAML